MSRGTRYRVARRVHASCRSRDEAPYLRLVEVDGEPRQVVDFTRPYEAEIIDFRGRKTRSTRRSPGCVRSTNGRSTCTDDLVVSMLLQVADDRTFWYMRAHHIAVDGYAALTTLRMTVERYNAARRGAPLEEKPFATLAEVVADDEVPGEHAPSHRRCALGVAGRRHAGTVDAVATRCDRAARPGEPGRIGDAAASQPGPAR